MERQMFPKLLGKEAKAEHTRRQRGNSIQLIIVSSKKTDCDL